MGTWTGSESLLLGRPRDQDGHRAAAEEMGSQEVDRVGRGEQRKAPAVFRKLY